MTSQSKSPTGEQLIRAFQYAAETRRFEIERFWQRSLFFWGFIAAAFIGYATLSDKKFDPHLRQVITDFGLISSLAWTLQNRGGKYWQEAWEAKVDRLEQAALGMALFGAFELPQPKGLWGGRRYSVSKLTTQLSDFTVAIWLLLAWFAFFVRVGGEADPIALSVAVVTCGFCLILLVWGRSTPPPASCSGE